MAPTDRPTFLHPAYTRMQPGWTLCRDVREGTAAMRRRKDVYLPRFMAEEDPDWNARVTLTTSYDALAQTINAMVGLAFRFDPTLGEDVPPELVADWESLDGEGNHGSLFLQAVLDAALQDGHAAILAEYPRVEGPLTLADQRANAVRPYAVRVTADQILNWRTMLWGGQRILSQVTLSLPAEQPTGAFGVETVDTYRVYRQQFGGAGPFVAWEEWRAVGGAGLQLVAEGVLDGPTLIPLHPVYGGQAVAPLESIPPLLGLAYTNIEHTQVKSDRRYSQHICSIPVPVYIGRDAGGEPAQLKHSVTSPIDISIGGDAKYLEPSGVALEDLRLELEAIERRMASQGLSLLQRDRAVPETATAYRLQRGREESKLARAVRSLQDAAEATLQDFAAYYGLRDGGSLFLRRDFSGMDLSEGVLRTLSDAEQRGQLTLDTLLLVMANHGLLPDDVDPVQEAEAVRRGRAVAEEVAAAALPPVALTA